MQLDRLCCSHACWAAHAVAFKQWTLLTATGAAKVYTTQIYAHRLYCCELVQFTCRSAKRAAKHAEKPSSTSGTTPAPAPAAATMHPSQSPAGDWEAVKGSSSSAKATQAGSAEPAKVAPKTHAELIQDAYKQHAETMQAAKAGTVGPQTAAAGDRSMAGAELERPGSLGPLLDQLPPDTLSGIMCLLGADDLARLGSTCHGLKMAVDDGLVWRSMLQREFPQSQLTASSAADWKHTYLLQVGLTCCSEQAAVVAILVVTPALQFTEPTEFCM